MISMLLVMAPFFYEDVGANNVALGYQYGDPAAPATGTREVIDLTSEALLPDVGAAALWGFTQPSPSNVLIGLSIPGHGMGIGLQDMLTTETDAAFITLASKLNTLKALNDVLDAQVQAMAAKLVFPIWAEENGGMANGAFEWSWGNGAVGTDIGIPVHQRCELVSATFNADTFGTSISIHVRRSNASVELPLFTSQDSVVNFANPVVFEAGDLVSFQTGVVTGTFTDSRICAWFRII